ncbi:hypothetical protein [Porcipelethomonas sp.]|uniref:hypothetical protein n=1 Tax=Porcipelethomonas sp. TaxID=2981675 RepID=UPI003EF59CA1
MTETFFGGKIGVIVWIFSVIAVFLALLLLCILSFAAMVKAKKDDFQNISDLLIVGMAAFIISYAVFVIEFIIVIDIFILMCLITIFLLIPQMWEIFGPLIELLFMLIPGLIVGIIWFIKTIDIKNTLKNLDFYKNLK